ncbi:MAG: iron ABC transporter permease [Veillonella caviae]|uniref:FecCD family ABC transporter permease n=1 Tax=Veillonella caviae TaxID=248316 RepID=UPI002A919FAE|nr:iron ABC transporter permease [Veillonella caviae]MDY5481177.1 iron ABC transporter permease [Veillonella caviae]
MSKQLQRILTAIGIGGALCICIILALHVGTIMIPIGGGIQSILQGIGIPIYVATPISQEQEAVLWFIRMPRVVISLLVGAALALAGAVMQGVFSNPLADPGIMGVSAGASLGAVLAIALGMTSLGLFYMPLFAFIGAFVSVGITIILTWRNNKLDTATLLLAGVAVSMLLGAFTSGILTMINEYRLREFLFWMVGGLDFRRWEHVFIAIGPILAGSIILMLLGRHLNVLVLGDTEARALGLPVMVYRILFLLLASLITATAVCVSGSIGFVGLVVPHIVRLLVGPDHRILLPMSALGGALFLVFCDTLGRVIAQPVEIRVGIMTALLGAPYFLFLLYRLRRKGGA